MNCNKKRSIYLISAMMLANSFLLPVFAQKQVEEEKQFTEVKSIDTGELKPAVNKAYDDAILIKEIQLDGNNLVNSDDILNKINIKAGSKFDRNMVQEDLKNIYKMGYFTEKIKAVPTKTDNGITLHIQVEENVPVTGFNFDGNNVISSEELVKLLKQQEGLPQNITELNNAIKNIEKLYADKGYILARVEKVSDDPDGVINIKVNEGVINEVAVTGNTKTRDFIITRNITIKQGDVYNENKIKQDISRIYGSQAFSDVRRVISISPDDPDKYKITVEVDEKRTGSISLGGGVDTETGFFGTVGYSDNNLRGLGQELNTNFTIGSGVMLNDKDVIDKAPLQFEANFVEPRLRNSLTSLRLSAFVRDLASYQVPLAIERRYGFETEFARPLKKIPNLAGSFSTGIEKVKMKEGNDGEITQKFRDGGYTDAFKIAERTKELKGGTYLTFGPELIYDTRNSIINPTSGWYSTGSLKESFKITGDADTYGKINTSVKRYLPVGEKSTIMLNGRLSVKALGELPEFAAFRLGGPYSIRGFREGDVGNGQGLAMTSAEFRTPVPFLDKVKYKFIKDIRASFFTDAGLIYDKTFVSELYNRPGYGISVGSGLIIPVPMLGPIRFDYGYPLTAVGAGNKRGAFSFAVGER
jgi:outer membrane protein insertion porin family